MIDAKTGVQRKIFYALAVFGDEEKRAVADALNAGRLGSGKLVAEFERRIAGRFGKQFGIATNSGSSANLLSLAALNLPPQSQVITPATTFATTFAPIIQLGLEPVAIDVEAGTYQADLERVERAITSRASAVLIPQLIGNAADLARLRAICDRHGLRFLDDSCDTIGTTVHGKPSGAYSDVSTTSFYASHVITAAGMGGMVLTDSEEVRDRVICMRDWGRVGDDREDFDERFTFELDGIPYDKKFLYASLGYNMKMPEVAAAFALAQEEKLDGFLATRRRNFDHLVQRLRVHERHLVMPRSEAGVRARWLAAPFMMTAETPYTRYDLLRHLEANGIQTRVIFSGNIVRHPAYRGRLAAPAGDLAVADAVMARGFLLGAHHGMTPQEVDIVADTVDEFFTRRESAAP